MKRFSESQITFDAGRVMEQAPHDAADAVKAILASAEATHRRIFNAQMLALRVCAERELYRLDLDPEFGVPFTGIKAWLKSLFPETYRYAGDALETALGLPDVPLDALAGMKRCNAVALADEGVSSHLKRDPEMIAAASTLSEKEFRAKLNQKGQHLDGARRLFKTFPESQAAVIVEALSLVAQDVKEHGGPDLETNEDRLWYWACDYVTERESVA